MIKMFQIEFTCVIRFLRSDLVLEDGGAEVAGELTLWVDKGGRRGADALTENKCILNLGSGVIINAWMVLSFMPKT